MHIGPVSIRKRSAAVDALSYRRTISDGPNNRIASDTEVTDTRYPILRGTCQYRTVLVAEYNYRYYSIPIVGKLIWLYYSCYILRRVS